MLGHQMVEEESALENNEMSELDEALDEIDRGYGPVSLVVRF